MKLPKARRPIAAVAVTAAAAAIVTPVAIAAPAAAAVTQAYFAADGGAVQHFVVPAAVSRIFVTAIGGSGGPGASRDSNSGGSGGAAGSVSAGLPVTPGQKLNIYIGNAGTAATSNSPGAAGTSSGLVVGGTYVYGGNGGAGDPASLGAGGGGGGATVLTAGSTPLLAAGGGGGGGGANLIAAGGAGGAGGNPAGNGHDGDGPVPGPGGLGARAGVGVNGQAGQDKLDIAGAGGGGGAGWNIPGGLTGGGGGGISSLLAVNTGDGGGGGGGAGASSAEATATSVHFATAAQFGNGNVFITWDQPPTITTLQGTGFSRVGQPATFTAVVGPGAPVIGEPVAAGTVGFFDGAKSLGNAPLQLNAAGQDVAVLSTSALAPGLHTITASYYGDAVYAGSTSDPLTQEVAAPTVFTSPVKLAGVVGVPLSFAVRTTGFPPPLLRAAGKLDGLKLTDHGDGTATLAGTPAAAGTFAITLSAGSLVNPVTYQSLRLTVTLKALSVTTSALPPAFVGQAYSATLAGQGGTSPFTWKLAGGHLPKGVTLNAKTGVLSGTPTTSGTSSFTVKVTDSSRPTRRTATKALRLTSNGIVPAVYAANGASDSVTSYPLSAGNLTPATRLAGTAQGLSGPDGLVLNGAGRLFVADSGTNAITEYDRGSTTPTVTIAGSNTGLASPAGLTLDAVGRLYVANRTTNSVTVFAAGAYGNAVPLSTIAGPDTALSGPAAVAIDASGRIWVANASANSLTAYAAGASGDAKPVARIVGSATGLNDPQGLAEDAGGNLLAANTFGESVTAYATASIGAASNPNVFPIRTISGSSTGLSFPDGIDVDGSGRIYVTNQFDNDITTYPATANGNVSPLATISGANTGLASPSAIAVTPPLSVLTSSLPPTRAGIVGGTPRHGGHWAFTVRETDSAHPHTVATRHFTITVAGR